MRNFYFMVLLLFGAFSCSDSSGPVFVEYCIPINTLDGSDLIPPTVGVVLDYDKLQSAPLGNSSNVDSFLIATESPLTIIKDNELGIDDTGYGPVSLAVVDRYSGGSDSEVSARLAFSEIHVVKAKDPSTIYPESYPQFDGVLGGDILRRFAVKFHYKPDKQCTFIWDDTHTKWPNIIFLREEPSSSEDLAEDGFGVVNYDFAGGGKFLVNGSEHDFYATRVLVGICLEPDPFPIDPLNPESGPPAVDQHYPISGIDMTGMIATGTDRLITTENDIEMINNKILAAGGTAALSSSEIRLQGDYQIASNLYGIKRMAIIGNIDSELGPCEELARRRGREWAAQNPGIRNIYPADRSYSGAAVLEIDRTRDGTEDLMSLTGISSYSGYWQGIWAETTPAYPSVDLILGNAFLQYFQFVIDYPNSRLIMRCLDYDCLNKAGSCCSNGVCRCPTGSSCCQYNKIK